MLDSKLFARALVDLVRRKIGTKIITLTEQEEGDLVELLFAIATKIRLDPEILPAWFYPAQREESIEANGLKKPEFAGATRRTDFPFFTSWLIMSTMMDGLVISHVRVFYTSQTRPQSQRTLKSG